jgi:CHAD domain-containing protein
MLTKAKPVLHEQKIREFAADTGVHYVSVVFKNVEGACSGHVEALHDMRVATRRLREALRLFEPFYSAARRKKTLAKIKKTTRILGLPREMDVNVELLRTFRPAGGLVVQTTYEHLLSFFEEQQSMLKKKMLKALDKLDLPAMESEWCSLAQSAVPDRSRTHLLYEEHQAAEFEDYVRQIPQLLIEKAEPVFAFAAAEAALGDDDGLHQLRIATKKLRYALEILKPLLEYRPGEPPIEQCRVLQDVLGDVHDRIALLRHLREHQGELSQKGLLLLGHGCSRIAAEVHAIKLSLLQQIQPAHQQLTQALSEYLRQHEPVVVDSGQ